MNTIFDKIPPGKAIINPANRTNKLNPSQDELMITPEVPEIPTLMDSVKTA